MYIKKKVLFVINVSITLFEKSFNAPASFLPIDNAGGGLRDLSEFASDLPFELKQSRFCFVPTFSALDIGAGTQPITYTEVVKPYSPAFPPASPKNVVASNFFANPSEAGASNEIHTQVTLRNGRWLFQEITGTPAFFSCSYQCLGTPVEAIISGQGIICTSQVYKINNLTVGSSAAWASTWSSAPYPTLVQNSPAANQCTITNTYQYPSATTLTATVTGACGTSILTKQIGSDHNNPIQAGTYNQEACYFYNTYNPGSSGSLPSTPNTPLYLRQGCMTIITLSSMGAKSVIYTGSVQPLYWNYNSGESKLYLQLPYMSGGIPFTFKISGQDEGACQNRSLLFFSYSQPYYSFSIAPNPVSDEQLNILAKPSEELLAQKSMESAAAELEYTVSLIDLATAETIGKQPIYFKGNLKERIDISKLRKGLYNLQISWGNEIQNIRFLKP